MKQKRKEQALEKRIEAFGRLKQEAGGRGLYNYKPNGFHKPGSVKRGGKGRG